MTLKELAREIGGEFFGPAELVIGRPSAFESGDPAGVVYVASDEFLQQAEASAACALIVPRSLTPTGKPYIQVDDPRSAFFGWAAKFDVHPELGPGIHPTAVVHPSATIDPTARVGPYAVIEASAELGRDVRVYAFAYVGEACVLKEESTVYPHAVLYRSVYLGERSVVHSGAVVGSDGFGFDWDGTRWRKVPQIGAVRIGSDCEIGPLSAVDRATLGETIIGDGTKIDNLVQVAHNTRIGKDGVIAAQTGIAGSSVIGDRVRFGGRSGTSDHITVCDDAALAGLSVALQDVDEPGEHLGTPARPIREARRNLIASLKLSEMLERIRRIERKLGGRED